MNASSRRVWGAIFLTQLFAGAAGVLLPALLFPGVAACWHLATSVPAGTICAPEAVAAGPLVVPFVLLPLPLVTILLVGLDALINKGFGRIDPPNLESRRRNLALRRAVDVAADLRRLQSDRHLRFDRHS